MSEKNVPFYKEYHEALKADRETLGNILSMMEDVLTGSREVRMNDVWYEIEDCGLDHDFMWAFGEAVVSLLMPYEIGLYEDKTYLNWADSYGEWFDRADEVLEAWNKREQDRADRAKEEEERKAREKAEKEAKAKRNKLLKAVRAKLNEMSDEELTNLLARL